jgi:NAD(P)H-dependent FMN reductase
MISKMRGDEAGSRIGIVISTTRQGRFGDKPAAWIRDIAAARSDLEVEIIDLRNYPMPFFNEPASPIYTPPTDSAARSWGDLLIWRSWRRTQERARLCL